MIVCGLDLSLTSAGIAILRNGRPIVIRTVGHKGHNGDDYAHRSRRIVSQCRAVMQIVDRAPHPPGEIAPLGERIDLAVIEGPSYGDNMPSNHDRAGLWWGVYSALTAKGVQIPTAVIAPSTLKLWFTGDGHADKRRMLDTARAMFREPVSDDNEADALALATAGAYRLGDPIPWEPCERSVESLERVDWPVGVGR